jgi:hypothetical protein
MARLEGKQSNSAWWVILLIIIIIAAVLVGLDYFGYINIVPNFGPR